MLYFLKKAGKIAAALGAPPLNPRWPPAAPPPEPKVVTLFLGIVKITTYYLILERQLVGPLAKLASPWLKPLVTPLANPSFYPNSNHNSNPNPKAQLCFQTDEMTQFFDQVYRYRGRASVRPRERS